MDYNIEIKKLVEKGTNNINNETVILNNGTPIFNKCDYEIVEGEPIYFELDEYGRSNGAMALISKNTIPLVVKKKLNYPDPYGWTKNLEGNYNIKIAHNNEEIPKNVFDITKLKLLNILKASQFTFKINLSDIKPKQYKKTLKKLLRIKKILVKSKKQIGKQEGNKIVICYIINYDQNNKLQNDFILGINAIFLNSRYERYNYIYDTVCEYLDNFFYGKNLCDFKNNKCGEKRLTNSNSCIGCCNHYKIKLLGPLLTNNLTPCEYLKEDYTCGAKCIGCKLFTCDYLEKKGIKFRIKDILLLDTFFNPLQKYFIKTMVFTPKEQVIKRLMIL